MRENNKIMWMVEQEQDRERDHKILPVGYIFVLSKICEMKNAEFCLSLRIWK